MVFDANFVIYFHSFDLWEELEEFLDQCGFRLTTTQSVYRGELSDGLRNGPLENLHDASKLSVVDNPRRRNDLSKQERKLFSRINRKGHKRPTSKVDQDLAWVAKNEDVPLLTCENQLTDLGQDLGIIVYDLIDGVDALRAANTIDKTTRRECFSEWPLDPHLTTQDLLNESQRRGAFDCDEADG